MTRILIPAVERPPVAVYGRRVRLSGATMGTTWSIDAWLPATATEQSVRSAIESRLDRVIAQMSTWEPDSFICRYSRTPAGSWIEAPDDFICVLTEAVRVAEISDGAFDPACGGLVDLWGFGPARAADAPNVADLTAACSKARWRAVRIDGARVLQPGGVQLDFSGIAKGYAVDLVADALRERGVPSALVEIGGELKGWGIKEDGAPWWVELEAPPDLAVSPERTTLALHDVAVASSGDYRRRRVIDGRAFSHTIDPATGAPLGDDAPAIVSVIHNSCMTADALATVLMVLGMERGARFAADHAIAARFIARRDGAADERISPAMRAMLG